MRMSSRVSSRSKVFQDSLVREIITCNKNICVIKGSSLVETAIGLNPTNLTSKLRQGIKLSTW